MYVKSTYFLYLICHLFLSQIFTQSFVYPGVEATSEEDTLPGKWLELDSFPKRRFLKHGPALYYEYIAINPHYFSKFLDIFTSTARPKQVPSFVPRPVYPEPVSHPTPPLVLNPVPYPAKAPTENLRSEESMSPQPSSSAEDDFPQQLSPSSSHVTENHSSEGTSLFVASTTEDSLLEENASLPTTTDQDFILEKPASSSALSASEEITSEIIEPFIESKSIEMIIAGSISAIVLLIILFIVIQIYWRSRKNVKMECNKFRKHCNMVYQTTVEVD